MPWSSSPAPPPVERARPLLGTRVAVRVQLASPELALAAIEAAFAEIERVDALFSFHRVDSELSRLHREAWRRAVPVAPLTWRLLRAAQKLWLASGGCFDPVVVAPHLVAGGRLPRPEATPQPDPGSSMADLRLDDPAGVRFARPLWLDLGGIAKGLAVDRAIARLRALGVRQARVDAGGDLRLIGPAAEGVWLRGAAGGARPVVELRRAALATSIAGAGGINAEGPGPHFDGRDGSPLEAGVLACVIAPRAWLADALTKVVLADVGVAARLLPQLGAVGYRCDTLGGWRSFPLAARAA
jgi:Membrane-associated lipoprotein involved in thiamine biosynthesis